MDNLTCATLLSGGGVAEIGMAAAGFTPIWGVEISAAIAEVYRANHDGHITVADILTLDPHEGFFRPTWLHASPVCTRASNANNSVELNEEGTKEAQVDIDVADKIAEFINVLCPDYFTLENVWAYRNFKAFKRIVSALNRNGYMYDFKHLNAANFGVPQTRTRLILRASLVGLIPHLPTPTPWAGWYAAIEDLIPTLPETKFAEWQLDRLPEELQTMIFNDQISTNRNGGEYGNPARLAGLPAFTVKAEQCVSNYKAFILNSQNGHGEEEARGTARLLDEPVSTVQASARLDTFRAFIMSNAKTESSDGRTRAFILAGQPNHLGEGGVVAPCDNAPAFSVTATDEKHPTRAWLDHGRVVKMTPRCLARFQSIPDSYVLPKNNRLAVRVIGNGVPPLLMQAIGESW